MIDLAILRDAPDVLRNTLQRRQAVIDVDEHNVVDDVHGVLDRMGEFATRVRAGQWLGATGQRGRPCRADRAGGRVGRATDVSARTRRP